MTTEQFSFIIIIAITVWMLSRLRKGIEKKRGNERGELKGEPRLSQRIASVIIMLLSVIAFSRFGDIESNVKMMIVIIISILIVIELAKITLMFKNNKANKR